ncbi:methylenetetrahydrofolate reductase [Helicobacter cappadocius]|uniref:Methylenetetrahydrofolate reductase n=1 Tax=Helicobacter cappadocius TaxID=3063998 RepID=A0AA90PZ63_9HELI|nr:MULTISPECIES: methylenetetrahydrofolate reductase [unclassified Helicobacter]MDO7253332.1 methylenetetrahydrofolate reductase [Helicobacter sp. faydin-H75]MDP2539238.1 methylenetetrahydrofolate reductase [Helicobacter sp. faydin-H76]
MIEECVHKLLNTKFLSYEINPPKASQIGEELLEKLGNWDGFDAIICTDAPLARFRHSPILSAIKLQNTLKKPVIATLNMRDRNSIALQGDILGANEFDVRMFLTLTGDPIKLGDQPESKGVFEGNSSLLVEIIKNFNQNKDLNQNPIKGNIKPIYPFGVINSHSNNLLSLKNKMRRKIKSGILALFTQPVYDIENAKYLLEFCEEINRELQTNAKLVFGYFPILKYKTAQFLYSKLPGVFVPQIWLEKLEKAHQKGEEEEEKVGFELSKELFKKLYDTHHKIHFMNSNKIDLAKKILS